MIRAVLFDMDETLLDRQGSLRRFAAAQYAIHQDAFVALSAQQFVDRFLTLDNNGALWKDEVYRQILDENGVTALAWETLLDEYISDFHRHCIPFLGVGEMVSQLSAEGKRLGLITNGTFPFQLNNFRALGIADAFSAVLVSEQEGMRKPSPEIFHRALKRLDVAAAEAVFVGDNPEADMQGARDVGMRTIYRPSRFWPACPFADAVCTDLRTLADIIRSFGAAL